MEAIIYSLQDFILFYPEFEKFAELDNAEQIFQMQLKEVLCMFPSLAKPTECHQFPIYALIAHYMIMNNRFASIGFTRPDGIINSSSVGSVSVSFESKLFSNQFEYFLSQTPYGLKFLAYWNSQTGVLYANN